MRHVSIECPLAAKVTAVDGVFVLTFVGKPTPGTPIPITVRAPDLRGVSAVIYCTGDVTETSIYPHNISQYSK
jgi:hypothetical protein